MSFNQFISIIKARKLIVSLTLIITVSTTVLISLILPKQYESSTSLIYNTKGVDPVSGFNISPILLPSYIATQVNVIGSRKVALKVVEKLSLNTNPGFSEAFVEATEGQGDIRIWIADVLLEDLEATPSREGSIIWLNYTSTSPEFAAVVANTFAEAYIDTNIELKVEPAKQAAAWFQNQVDVLKKEVEVAQQKLTDYEKEKGILFDDRRFDVETARLTQLTTALIQSEEQLFDLKTKLSAVNKNDINESDIDLLDDALINQVKVQLTQMESKFAEVKQRLSENHPEYKSTSAELVSVKRRLQRELGTVKAKLEESVKREQKRVSELTDKIESQKARLLVFNADRVKREVLLRDVDVAKHILSGAMERMSQTSMEGQADQADVAILNQAVPPIEHSQPKLMINTILSMFLGSVLALAFALISELFDRRVRTKSDLEMSLGIPVVGEVSKIRVSRKGWFKR